MTLFFILKEENILQTNISLRKKDTIADYYLLAPDIKLVKGKRILN